MTKMSPSVNSRRHVPVRYTSDDDDDTFFVVLVLVSETNVQPDSCWAEKKVLVVNKCKQYEQRETQGKTWSKKQSISKQKHFPRISFVKIMRD